MDSYIFIGGKAVTLYWLEKEHSLQKPDVEATLAYTAADPVGSLEQGFCLPFKAL